MRIVNPIGKKGEDLAVEFLRKKGWKILERNYRKQYGEIDIISIDTTKREPVLTFIEVKTRTSTQFGTPLEAITSWKLKLLLKTIQIYIHKHSSLPQRLRIDAIGVLLDKKGDVKSIDHLENIGTF